MREENSANIATGNRAQIAAKGIVRINSRIVQIPLHILGSTRASSRGINGSVRPGGFVGHGCMIERPPIIRVGQRSPDSADGKHRDGAKGNGECRHQVRAGSRVPIPSLLL